MQSQLLAFYRDVGPDHAGRRLQDMMAWDHDRLEGTHDYIQWLFPLTEPSAYNPWAPVLGESDIAAFRRDPVLQDRLRLALKMMLDFYGLACDEAGASTIRVRKAEHFMARSRGWLTPANHNYLRLTRILKSLSQLGLADHAQALQTCLEGIYGEWQEAIGATTLSHWRRAVTPRS